MIPARGCVLGIDVGWSECGKTTGMAVLWWDEAEVRWTCTTVSSREEDRTAVLDAITPEGYDDVLAVGVDGPLLPGLVERPTYRCAEMLLTWGAFGKRGKPGAGNAGNGPRLHQEATTLASLALRRGNVAPARHAANIHERAVVEAFPNLFLGVLCSTAQYPLRPRGRRWTDALFPLVLSCLDGMLTSFLPGRRFPVMRAVSGHDVIAGFVCALTALCIVAGRYVAVGAHADGFIVLPPHDVWGSSSWAERALRANVTRHGGGVVYRDDIVWMDGGSERTMAGGHGGAVQPLHAS
ncbi:MAG TPA: hypothetical protein VMR23_15930 [Candidatus Limnocylindria bacterium]|nr:hypothetical protein [Candidatus Limnocylindria bacterium]